METTRVYRDSIGFIMVYSILLGLYRVMEKKMETTGIIGLI